MATRNDLRRIALALDGTSEAPHFDRTAYRRARTFATVAPDGQTANLKFSPDQQELKCLVAPEAFTPLANAWGRQGWTVANLSQLDVADLSRALHDAWANAAPATKARRR